MHRFIAAERANHAVAMLCRVLGVSRAGFYAAQRRPPCHCVRDGGRLLVEIRRVAPEGEARATDGIPPPSRNQRTPTAAETPASTPASSLDAPRAIAAQKACRCSRRPAGGRPGDRIGGRPARSDARRFRLPIATPLDQVLRRRLEFAQYVSLAFGEHCREAGIDLSMTEGGAPLDNAVIESFFATLKKELVDRYSWPTRNVLRVAIFEWIEVFYNRQRLHTTLGNYAPEEFENLSLSAKGSA